MDQEKLLRGCFENLPPKDSNIVRIFLSSTFGDFAEERNKLSKDVYPVLQQSCQLLGLDFQVVDMRWGVRDENISYHQTSDVCIKEVQNCHRLSNGPAFIAFIGDRYGYRPFPSKIPTKEFNLFLQVGQDNGINTDILIKWYKLDSNALDQVYVLLPITTYFPNYVSADSALRAADQGGWWETFLLLQSTMWKLVKMAVQEGALTEDRAHIYLQSVTEDEIDHGIFRAESPNKSCLCYTRTLLSLRDSIQSPSAQKYIDVCHSTVDKSVTIDCEAQEMLHEMKFNKLPSYFDSKNISHFEVPWVDGGISASNEQHQKYLDSLCNAVCRDVQRLIEEAVKTRNKQRSPLYDEVLHHSTACVAKCDSYCNRGDDVLDRIQGYIKSQHLSPLIVHGESGSGKTSVMAKAASSAREWCSNDSVIVARFLGTSPHSSNIRQVLMSICQQISSVYSNPLPNFEKMDGIEVIQYFRNSLFPSLEGKMGSSSLVLLLDSIDQLSEEDSAHSMKWLPQLLPPNVRIVVSMLNKAYNCLENVRSIIPACDENYIEIGAMPLQTCEAIIDHWLLGIGRCITQEQRDAIRSAVSSCPQPLFLKLLFGRARGWRSFTAIKPVLPRSTSEALSQFYENLEELFGVLLVQRALGYLTASRSGITESELEDVLSLDDEVLNDVYQYWDPPNKGIVRIPSLLWKRIHFFIKDYIVEQQSGNMSVMVWYHRQFRESATARYITEGGIKPALHRILAEFFEGKWSNSNGRSVRLNHRDLTIENADRQVAQQPLLFGERIYNLRKLNELPFHLLFSDQSEELKENVLCDFDWIQAKLIAMGYITLVNDYLLALRTLENDKELSLICETLSLASSNLKDDSSSLPGQLLGRLHRIQSSSDYISKLLSNARQCLGSSPSPVLEPLNNCLISPGGELRGTLSGHSKVISSIKKSCLESCNLVVSSSKSDDGFIMQVWDVSHLECIENPCTMKVLGSNKDFVFDFYFTAQYLYSICGRECAVWNIKAGYQVHTKQLNNGEEFSCMAMGSSGEFVVVGTTEGNVLWKQSADQYNKDVGHWKFNDRVKSILLAQKHAVVLIGNSIIAILDNDSKIPVKSMEYDHQSFTISHILPSPNTNYLIAGAKDGTVHIIDLNNFNTKQYKGHSKEIKCMTHVSEEFFVTGSMDKTLCLWDLSGSCKQKLKGHVDGVWCVDHIESSDCIVSGSKDDYLKVWNVFTGDCLATLEGHSSWISCVLSLSSDLIISGSNDKMLKVWKLNDKRDVFSETDRHRAQPECIALVGTKYCVSGAPDDVKIWDPLNGNCIQSLGSSASCLAFSQDGTQLVTGLSSGQIEVYDVSAGFSKDRTLAGHSDKVTCLKSVNNTMISASLDSTIKLWNSNYENFCCFDGHESGIACLTASHHSSVLASGSKDMTVRLWSMTTHQCTCVLGGHEKSISCIAFHSDDQYLISGSDDFTARVWSTETKTCVMQVKYPDSVKAVCVPSQGCFIAGAHCAKNQLKLWNIERAEHVRTFTGHTHAVMCMLPLKDQYFITGSRDGTVRLWSLESDEMKAKFDLQSQVKHISVTELGSGAYLLAATTKSGPIAFLKFSTSF